MESRLLSRTTLPRTDTIIIGAGPAGLSAAEALRKYGKKSVILEKESKIGGKCHTYTDPHNPENKTEWGAGVVAHNYGEVIDKIQENKLLLEALLPIDLSTMPFIRKIKKMGLFEKTTFRAQFIKEMIAFANHAVLYQRLRDQRKDLPDDYKLPFAEFAKNGV